MATVAELDAQWEAQYQVVLAKKQELTAAQQAVAVSPAYQNGTEAERLALGQTGAVEAARLAFNTENQKLTALKKELDAAKAAEETNAATTSQGTLSEVQVTSTQDDANPTATTKAKSTNTLSEVVVTAKPEKESLPKGAPGARTFNPLSNFSSYTYHITLYMITPYTYNKFIEQGNKGISPKDMFVVAESGGTNTNGKNFRLFADLDYYIDDFNFQTYLSTNATKGASVDSLAFNFKIYEPFGFSFMSRLKAAALSIVKKSTLPGHDKAPHHLQQLYMIGIKFYGYDANGNLVTDDTSNQLVPNTATYSISSGTESYDQFADNGVFARYFPISLTEVQFKLDGKTTHLTHKKAELSDIMAETEKEESFLLNKSAELRGKSEERLLAAYDRIRTSVRNGLAVVSIERGASAGSFFTIPPQTQMEIAARKKIITDEHSGRILVDGLLADEEKEKMEKLFATI